MLLALTLTKNLIVAMSASSRMSAMMETKALPSITPRITLHTLTWMKVNVKLKQQHTQY